MKKLADLGKVVAAQQDEAIEEAQLVARTEAQLAWPDDEPVARRRFVPLALAAVLLGGVVAAVVAWRSTRPITIETKGVDVDAWVSAVEEQPVAFSDGATVLAAPGARFKVARLDAAGAKVTLERGSLSVSVPHRDRTRWSFDVGPFVVHVVGTRFDTGWDAQREAFTLEMHDGAVRVEGPGLADTRYVAGQKVALSLRAHVEAAPAVEVPPAPDEPEVTLVEPEPLPSATPKPQPVPAWKRLAQKRQYPEALAAAEALGFPALCSTAPMADLSLLGDVARLARAPAKAKEAYQALRDRFPKSRGADAATFFLGRLAFDAKDDEAAEAWFSQYLGAYPSGVFAAEALGRRLELARRAGATVKARALAKEYLSRYPTGPHSRLATSVLGDE